MEITPQTLLVIALLGTPALTSLICIPLRGDRAIRAVTAVNVVGALLLMLLGSSVALLLFTGPARYELFDLIYLDSLSGWLIAITSILGGMAALYSVGYMRHEVEHGAIPAAQMHWYYFWFHQALFTMLLALSFNNLGLQWASIEGTTLTTAFLVGFYQKKGSLEAAWKYVILCTVGLTLALLGVLLAYASAVGALGEASDALNWTVLRDSAGRLDPGLIRLAFVFALVGFGTKAGLAPMHTWLPDAHSQAPTPVSALLSGVLLNCALYGILRYHILASDVLGPGFSSSLLIGFGLFSIAVAVPFILVQRDLKRLLAYSSVEHIGIIVLAVGIGGPLGLFGAMLHMLNHSLAKVLLFFTAGNVGQRYGTLQMLRIRGVAQSAPLVSTLLLLGGFAIAGAPPFNIFVSEFSILSAGFAQQLGWVSVLFLVLIALVFAGMLFHLGRMVLGEPWRARRQKVRSTDGHIDSHDLSRSHDIQQEHSRHSRHSRHARVPVGGRAAIEQHGAGATTVVPNRTSRTATVSPPAALAATASSAGLTVSVADTTAGGERGGERGMIATTLAASPAGEQGEWTTGVAEKPKTPTPLNSTGGTSGLNVQDAEDTKDTGDRAPAQNIRDIRDTGAQSTLIMQPQSYGEHDSGHDSEVLRPSRPLRVELALPLLLAIPVVILGLYVPPPLVDVLSQLAAILQGRR